jgi:hypothetical protein
VKSERPMAAGWNLVLSAEELGFQQVLDTLPQASRVAILTYNFAKASGELVQRLRELPSETRLDIVSNIPETYETYYGPKPIARARRRIDEAKGVLDPKNYQAQTMIRFHLSNHAKIVATDLCAYVGSANFSDESADSVELGFVTTSAPLIAEVFKLFDEVATHAILNPGAGAAKAVLEVQEYLAELRAARDMLHQSLFQESDHHYAGVAEYFAPADVPRATLRVVEDILELFSTSLKEAREALAGRGLVLPEIDESLIDRAQKLIDARSNFGQLLRFDSVAHAGRVLEANKEAFDEDLDRFAQAAAESAQDERDRLAEQSEEKAQELLSVLDALSQTLAGMESSLKAAMSKFEAIRP